MAGIIDETGKERYVMHAVDIIHDFLCEKDGKYKVFVENRYKKEDKNRNSDLCGEMINEEICNLFLAMILMLNTSVITFAEEKIRIVK